MSTAGRLGVIETARVRLRPLSLDDLAEIHEVVLGDASVTWDGRARTIDEARASLESKLRHVEDHGFGMMAATDRSNDEFLGYAGLQLFEDGRQIELGYYFGQRAWGRGLATEVARALVEYAFDVLHLEHVVAVVRSENDASKGVLAKAGLSCERRAHHYEADVEFWSIYPRGESRVLPSGVPRTAAQPLSPRTPGRPA